MRCHKPRQPGVLQMLSAQRFESGSIMVSNEEDGQYTVVNIGEGRERTAALLDVASAMTGVGCIIHEAIIQVLFWTGFHFCIYHAGAFSFRSTFLGSDLGTLNQCSEKAFLCSLQPSLVYWAASQQKQQLQSMQGSMSGARLLACLHAHRATRRTQRR